MNRKEIKKEGHRHFRKHYLMLIFLCIIMSFFGTEGSSSVRLVMLDFIADSSRGASTVLRPNDVFLSIASGDLTLSEELTQAIEESIPNTLSENDALGTTGGVLAGVVNSILSGRFYMNVANSIFGFTHSETLTGLIFLIMNMLWMILIWFLLQNIFSAILRRIFLEGRTYERIPFTDLLQFAAFRKWLRTCWTLFVRYIFEFLWSLTIVGGVIKHYSYYLVPYIVAENPGIKATKAITISRKMMKGHKLEAFVLDLSFIGWYLLAIVTVGVSDAFYGFPYRMAVCTEYYVKLRAQAKENEPELVEALNDTYLYEHADKITLYEAYFDIVDMQTVAHENKVELNRAQEFMLKWFSIWVGRLNNKRRYDISEGYRFHIVRGQLCRDGHAYPVRLNQYWRPRKKSATPFSFMRSYSIWTLMLMFILFCFIGWTWEVCLHYAQTGDFVNRGMLHGPWLPIYGCGGLIALLLCSRFRVKPLVEFFVAVALCGVIEYFAAYFMEMKYNEKWWSYDGFFLNINGRVCAEGLLVFGIACMLVVYFIAPLFDVLISKISNKAIMLIAIAVMAVFLADLIYSVSQPNVVPGAVETSLNAPAETGTLLKYETPQLRV